MRRVQEGFISVFTVFQKRQVQGILKRIIFLKIRWQQPDDGQPSDIIPYCALNTRILKLLYMKRGFNDPISYDWPVTNPNLELNVLN